MNKRIITLSLMGLLTLGTLTGCSDVKAEKVTTDGQTKEVIVKVGDKNYTADDLFAEYSGTTSGASAYYNAIYDVLIREAQPITTTITNAVNSRIDDFTEKAKEQASNNSTTYKTELSALLEDEGVNNLKELREIYTLDEQKKVYEDKYYDDNMDSLKLEYLATKTPYHVSHILVKTDNAGSSLYKGTITAAEATKISSVINSLIDNKFTFGQVAKENSEDNSGETSSASYFGDLGIMDQDTSFVPEFKYNVFAYDAYLNGSENIKPRVEGETIEQELNLDKKFNFNYDGASTNTVSVRDALSSVNEIPYKVVDYLSTLTEETPKVIGNVKTYKDANGNVKDVDDSVYPRNILFNTYFNDHGISVITNEGYTGDSTKFKSFPRLSSKPILTDGNNNPILVTRAGSSYQGIHFITINKSPFDGNDEAMLAYYSTENIPSTSTDVSNDKRFITAVASNNSTYTERAKKVKDAVKGFDPYLNYRIYEDLVAESNVEIKEEVKSLISKYISSQRAQTAYTNDASTTATLKSFVQLLQLQDAEKAAKQVTFKDINHGTQKLFDDIPEWLLA